VQNEPGQSAPAIVHLSNPIYDVDLTFLKRVSV
jgi:hypothetical protein